MKWNKNVIAFISAIIIMSLILVGCGAESEDTPSETPDKPESNDNSNDNEGDEVVTLKFHHWFDLEDERLDIVIDEFEAQNTDIKIEPERLDPAGVIESMKKLDILAASGEELDVVLMPSVTELAQRVEKGFLEPLTDHMEAIDVDLSEEYTVDTSIDGEHYGLPFHYQPWVTILNKDLLDENGLEVPQDWTFDDFVEYAKVLTKGEGIDKVYGTYLIDMYPHATYYGAIFNHPEENALVTSDRKPNVNNDRLRKALEVVQKLEMEDESVLPFADRISQDAHYAHPYFNGESAMNILGGWMIARAGGYSMYPATFTTAFAPFPKFAEDEDAYLPAAINFISIAASSEKKDAAIRFAHFLSTEGVLIQEQDLSVWSGADIDVMVDNIMSKTDNPDLVDIDSLKDVLRNSKPTKPVIPPPYYNEVRDAFVEEVELFLLGDQDIDGVISNSEEKIEKIIETHGD